MNPSIPRLPAKDPALRREAQRHVSTTKDLLSGELTQVKIQRCWELLIKALGLDPCAPGGAALLVAATALRATHPWCGLPSGAVDPYLVLGLDPAVLTARDPAVIESYYRQASDLLDRCSNHRHPCFPALCATARLVADAWAVLSDAGRKASLDARLVEAPQPPAPPTAQAGQPPPLPSAPRPPEPTAQAAGQQDMGRSAPVTGPPAAMTTPSPSDGVHERRAGLRVRQPNIHLAGNEWIRM